MWYYYILCCVCSTDHDLRPLPTKSGLEMDASHGERNIDSKTGSASPNTESLDYVNGNFQAAADGEEGDNEEKTDLTNL